MLRKSLILVALAALLLPGAAAATTTTTELMPGVSYTREVRWANGGPLVVHAIVAPKPGGAYEFRPVLSNDLILGRERLSSMQRRLSRRATAVGVNGDLFNWSTGHPSGIVMQDGAIEASPSTDRSSLAVDVDGLFHVDRLTFFGSAQLESGQRFPLARFNRPAERGTSVLGVFTPTWGARTPRIAGALDVVVSDLPRTYVDADLTGIIASVRRGGGTAVPAGGAVIQATGFWADRVAPQIQPGQALTVRLQLKPWWNAITHAIGGGPVLVRNGSLAFWGDEGFTSAQLVPRHPRTAVAQLSDGRILLLAIDGRSSWSSGVTVSQLALELIRLGAQTAMALDAGGSTTIAFDGKVLNRPSDGVERPVSDALMVLYNGAFAPEPRYGVVSPNGDGVAESQRLAYKVVRTSTVDVRLVGPDDAVVWSDSGTRQPGTYVVNPKTFAQEGRYRWVVEAVDEQGQETGMTRAFSVNNTLGFLRLSPQRLRLAARKGGKLGVSFRLGSAARRLDVTVAGADGRVVRRLYRGRDDQPGQVVVTWNGRDGRGRVVRAGVYTVRAEAVNGFGRVALERKLAVRVAGQAANTRR